jgi:hypothetical protein
VNILKYEGGWVGGKFTINGTNFDTSKKPKATLIIENKRYDAVYKTVSGYDDDHGHSYPWSLTHIGILDGVVKERFLSVSKLSKHEVLIEFVK